MQIGEENIHLARMLLDEVFGQSNFVSQLSIYKTTTPRVLLDNNLYYLLWYARDIAQTKYRQIYLERDRNEWISEASGGSWGLTLDEEDRPLTPAERNDPKLIPSKAQVYELKDLSAAGASSDDPIFQYGGVEYRAGPQKHWKTKPDGLLRLASQHRIEVRGGKPWYKRYHKDFPVTRLTNVWSDTSGKTTNRIYVVQTGERVIERCLLMTTDPGDLVLDPTCGSGTTAYVAEQWGRRWITTDTSRVAIALAKQRLVTATFDYYTLAHPDQGVGSGFKYKTVPHVTLKSIANNPEVKEGMTREDIDRAIAKYADTETLYDQPEVDNKKARVTGPFTVEAVPAAAYGQPEVRRIDPIEWDEQKPLPGMQDDTLLQPDASIARQGQTLRQSEWRTELLKTGIRAKGGAKIEFVRVEPLPGTRWLSADSETKEDKPRRAVISFGPEHAPLEQRQVAAALEEAQSLVPRPALVIFAALQFDPEAAKDIDETKWPGVTMLKAQMNGDLVTDDLKKKRSSNESFWLIGQPDIQLRTIAKGEHKGKYEIEVHGFDYYNPKSGNVESGGKANIAMWMLDTDYDGRSIYPQQVFFPMAGPKDGWARLAKNLRSEIDPELIEQYRGTVSLPFEPGKHGRVAVKIVDDRGIESLRIVDIPGAGR